jgi:hypothetical protein
MLAEGPFIVADLYPLFAGIKKVMIDPAKRPTALLIVMEYAASSS